MRVWCCGVGCGLWHRWCSGCCLCVWAGLLCAPVGGGPPARSPHASLRLGVIDLEARPGPAAAHRHRSLALRPLRCPPHQWGVVCCVWWRVDSKPGQASPRPRAPQPGPGLLYVAQRWLSIINFACNSPVACSNIEFASLELQRFQTLLKLHPIELHATFLRPGPAATHGRRVWVLQAR